MDRAILLQPEPHRLFFECVSGSRAYGTANASSDSDLRGMYAQSAAEFLAIAPPPAPLADERHNAV